MSRTSFAEADIRPLRVGRRLWVGPAGAEPPAEPGLVPIWLEPGLAFGTGSHPTTQLCLRALERHFQPGAGLLDLGAGSGILSIAGAKLGAGAVLGLDTDGEAVHVARGNVDYNRVADRVRVEQGTLSDALSRRWGEGRASWVVTNILRARDRRILRAGPGAGAERGRLVDPVRDPAQPNAGDLCLPGRVRVGVAGPGTTRGMGLHPRAAGRRGRARQ